MNLPPTATAGSGGLEAQSGLASQDWFSCLAKALVSFRPRIQPCDGRRVLRICDVTSNLDCSEMLEWNGEEIERQVMDMYVKLEG